LSHTTDPARQEEIWNIGLPGEPVNHLAARHGPRQCGSAHPSFPERGCGGVTAVLQR